MGPNSGTVDEIIGRIASRQHGVVTRAQLLDAGVSEKEIKRRIERKALLRVHRGVYRVGHKAPSIEARYMAAVLACGEGAVLSGQAAGYLWGLIKGTAPPPEVTAPTNRRIKGIRTRRARRQDTEATTWRGIPITTVPRTLVDLASMLSLDDLARACHEAGVKHHTTPRQVEEVLAKRPTAPGAGKPRKVMHGDVHVTLSGLERRSARPAAPSHRHPGRPHVHALAAEGNALGLEQASLALALGERAVGAHDALPGHIGVVGGVEHRAGVAGRLGAQVAVGGHVAARHRLRALEHGAGARGVGIYRAA
jgi:Transcriptional regulator, AbiEi antitoxin